MRYHYSTTLADKILREYRFRFLGKKSQEQSKRHVSQKIQEGQSWCTASCAACLGCISKRFNVPRFRVASFPKTCTHHKVLKLCAEAKGWKHKVRSSLRQENECAAILSSETVTSQYEGKCTTLNNILE